MKRLFLFLLVAACGHTQPPITIAPHAPKPHLVASAAPVPQKASAGWTFKGSARSISGRTAKLSPGPSQDVMLAELGSPRADEPLAAGNLGFDFDGRAIAVRTVALTGCSRPPMMPNGFALDGDPNLYSISSRTLPLLVDLGTGGSAIGIELQATFDCKDNWKIWLGLPLADAMRDSHVKILAREYVVPTPDDLKWNNPSVRDASAPFVAAGGHYGILEGATGTTFAPEKPSFENVHLRIVQPEPIECHASAGKLQDGTPTLYTRTLADENDRRYLVARTDRIVIVGNGSIAGTNFETHVQAPEDKSCANDLVPKLVDSRARALALHIPAEHLDDPDLALDFTKDSIVFLGRPTSLERLQGNEISLTFVMPRTSPCPGGRPPDPGDARLPSPSPSKVTPADIDPHSLERAFVVPKGKIPVVHKIGMAPPACLPMPTRPQR